MGRTWIRTLNDTPDVDLVAIVDLDEALIASAIAEHGLTGVSTGRSVSEVAAATALDAVVNVTVPAAHHPVNTESLYLGLPVLCEKPITPTVAQALSLAAASEHTGRLVMASQSRRYGPNVATFRECIRAVGGAGTVSTEFFKAPHFGGFREQMPHVLLVDMSIHHFDQARYLLDDDPVAVYCRESNPGWSWFDGASTASAVFEFRSGATFSYTGSWCADGFETSWNGSWRVNGPDGTALWDGETPPDVAFREGVTTGAPALVDDVPDIQGALREFVDSLRTGDAPSGEIRSNILSLAMGEAAVQSAVTGTRVLIEDVIEAARAEALRTEARPELFPLIEKIRIGAPPSQVVASTP
jgi:predicted dehydrogenase